MSIPPAGRIRARREAPLHVQLALTNKPDGIPQPHGSEVAIGGYVVKVFRGESLVSPGALVTFALWVCRRGDEPTGPAYVHDEALARASHVEAFLYGTPPQCRLAAYEFEIIDAPTQVPVMTIEELERLE